MKKALLGLAFSIIVLMGVLSYDIIKWDGKVLLNPLLHIDDTDYSVDINPVNNPGGNAGNTSHSISAPARPDTDDELEELEVAADSAGMPDEIEVEEVRDDERGYEFYFPQLTNDEKNMYRAMYNAFVSVESGNSIPFSDEKHINVAASALRNDHPELFYVGTIGYTHYTLGGQIQKTTLSVNYPLSKAGVETRRKMIERQAQAIIDSIPQGADDYTKVKLVYEAIIEKADYDLNSPDNQTIESVLLNRRSVCAGYARTMQYILNKVGVPTTFVEGVALVSGEEHAWNLCKLEDGYYFVDATWGDATYSNGNRGKLPMNGINYDYLLVTSEELLRTHRITSDIEIPVCTATQNNYYIREGLYLEYYDYDIIMDIFKRGYANGQETVSFKCASDEVYQETVRQLLTNSIVFDMLDDRNKTVSYVNQPEQRTLCFWL